MVTGVKFPGVLMGPSEAIRDGDVARRLSGPPGGLIRAEDWSAVTGKQRRE